MVPSLPLLLDDAQLPPAELNAARLDGDVRELAGKFCSVDIHPSSNLRGQAIAPLVPAGLIVERLTAAWLHGATPRFVRPVQLCIRSDRRVRVQPSIERTVRQVVLAERETFRAGPVLVTDPFRTAIDLIRGEAWSGRGSALCVTTLLLGIGATPEDCRTALRQLPHLPHKRRALDRLEVLPGFG